jgi:hypothetical protein
MNRALARWLCSVCAATLLSAVSGCVPGVTWLPDSSGFYFTTGNHDFDARSKPNDTARLLFFDVATRKIRVLPERGHNCIWPAVKPDGTEIAVSRLIPGPNKSVRLQLVFFNREGKRLRTSKAFQVSGFYNGQVFWSPKGGKLLITSSGIYDVATDTFRPLSVGVPPDVGASCAGLAVSPLGPGPLLATSALVPVLVGDFHSHITVLQGGPTPFPSSGKGFLAYIQVLKSGGDSGFLAFIDVSGKVHPIDVTPAEEFAKAELPPRRLQWYQLMERVRYRPEWERNVAVAEVGGYQVRIDTEKLVANIVKTPEEKVDRDGKWIDQEFSLAKSTNRLRVIQIAQERTVDLGSNKPSPAKKPPFRIELLHARANKAQVLVPGADECLLFPSPNREYLAVGWLLWNDAGGRPTMRLMVINQQGEKIADLDVLDGRDGEKVLAAGPDPGSSASAGFPWFWVGTGGMVVVCHASAAAIMLWWLMKRGAIRASRAGGNGGRH